MHLLIWEKMTINCCGFNFWFLIFCARMGYLTPRDVNCLEVFKDKKLANYYTKAYNVPSHVQIFHMLNKYIVLMNKQNMTRVVGILLHHVIPP